jgi:hypothetical protein
MRILFFLFMNLLSWSFTYFNSYMFFVGVSQSVAPVGAVILLALLIGFQFGCSVYVNKLFLESVMEKIYG